jgi:hypothetical protein
MLTVPATITAHQRKRSRRPSVTVEAAATRHGVPVLKFTLDNSSGEPAAPVDIAFPTGEDPCRARNNAGSLDTLAGFDMTAAWTNRDTITAGQGFAVAFDPVAERIVLAYGDGNDVKVKISTDNVGSNFGASTTLVTEASAIGSVAVAADDAGDVCVFYTLGTTTTLKRLRRTAGTWAVAGTTWTRSASVASLTGIAAVWRDDYYLVVTGTVVTTLHKRVWTVAMGDTSLPANAWSGLNSIHEADAASTISYSYPHCAYVGAVLFATFQQVEAGNVASSRPYLTHTADDGSVLADWAEPRPAFSDNDGTSAYGAAIGYGEDATYLETGNREWIASDVAAQDLSGRLQALRWEMTPSSLKVRLELTDQDGSALPAALALGNDLTISHGWLSGALGAAEYGATLSCNVSKISRRFDPPSGKRLVIVEAGGLWETLARFHAPAAWTAPSGTTRGDIFSRVAGRAGLRVVSDGTLTPSAAWSTDTPTFAIAAGESARTTLTRLLAPTADFLRPDVASAGAFVICGLSWNTSPPAGDLADYGWPVDAADPSPLISVTFATEHEPNWFRVQGADRYADHFDIDDNDEAAAFGASPWFQLLRDVDVNTDAEATATAKRLSDRSRFGQLVGEAVVPANVAHELYDVVSLDVDPMGGSNGNYRVLTLACDYRRGPASGAPAFLTTFGLGRV